MDANLHFYKRGVLGTPTRTRRAVAMALTINNLHRSVDTETTAPVQAFSQKCKSLHIAGGQDIRPHVLFVIDALLAMGGTERVLLKMIRLLPKDRFRCSLVAFKGDETAIRAAEIDCPFHLLPLQKTFDLNALRVARRLRGLIREEHVDIVHTFFETSDLWAGPIARLSGHPVLISSRRDMGIARSLKHSIGYKLVRNMYDAVLAVSPQVRNYSIECDGVKPAKARTLFNGIDVEEFIPVECREAKRRKLEIPESTPVVITVANIRRIKGLDVMVEAAFQVRQRYPEVLFLIAGKELEAEYARALQSRITQLGLEKNIRFLGARSDVFALLAMSDVFCLPSRSEGFSNALIEAMAAGLPSVATDVGGNREVLEDGQSGFIVGSEDAQALAQRLTTLLEDSALARFMGKRAQTVARDRFTVQAMMKGLVEIYDELLAARGRTPCSLQS